MSRSREPAADAPCWEIKTEPMMDHEDVTRIRVQVISENRLIRESLTRILSKRAEFCVLHEGCHTDGHPEDKQPLVLLLDSAKPVISELKGPLFKREECSMILIGMEEDEEIFLQVIRRGVMGYLLKDASSSEVVSAVKTVARGEAVCPQRLCRFLFRYVTTIGCCDDRKTRNSGYRLTRREGQLIPLIDKGLTNKQMASVLGISEQTIKNHVHHILRKTGLEDRVSIGNAYSSRAEMPCDAQRDSRPPEMAT